MTWPVPPAVPISPMMARMMSLAVTPAGSLPSTVTRMFFALRWISVWVASTCSTSEVPMPLASAPKAPWVEVWLSPHTIVMPGSVKPCSGPMMWTMPWRWSSSLKYSMPKSAAFLASVATCTADSGFLMPCERSVVGTLWSTTASVRCGERTLRPRGAQALERLRARHLVDEVAVDVDERRAVGILRDDVVVPDLVVERLRSGHGCDSWCLG